MTKAADKASRFKAVCPHDCPSTCALLVERLDAQTIGRVYGDPDQDYTRGVICAKVSRYAERIHHPDRLLQPLRRRGGKGGQGSFEAIAWDAALDLIAERWQRIIASDGAEAIWPYHYAGTMGLVQRDGLERLRRSLGTSRMHGTFCVTIANAGYVAGVGSKRGADARRIDETDLLVVWGGNPVNTQVNVMNRFATARRERGARLVVVDPWRTGTAARADLHLALKPGTDGALACAVMHVLFRDALVDRDYLQRYSDCPDRLEQHLKSRTPAWAAQICGLEVGEIEQFAAWYGQQRNSFIRIGYGFSRSRNGAVNMHAVSCLPMLTGAWRESGGGALYGQSALYSIDKTLIEGLDLPCHSRTLDQSRIGAILCGDRAALGAGAPVRSLFVQNTNPAVVAPASLRVREGLQREDLFTVVHEQFMTETAAHADLVLPATMFLEHDDLYIASGHTWLQFSRKLIEAPGDCRSNHAVLSALASRLGLAHPAFAMSEWELIEASLQRSSLPDAQTLWQQGGHDVARDFEQMNFASGFDHADGRFHFAPEWSSLGPQAQAMPSLPDHWDVLESPDRQHPLRLVAAPARQFLNTTFNETATARRMEQGEPLAQLNRSDLAKYGLVDGEFITLFNARAEVSLRLHASDKVPAGRVVVESLWPNAAFAGGIGINALVSDEPAAPNGGAVYHDTAVGIRAGRNGDHQP